MNQKSVVVISGVVIIILVGATIYFSKTKNSIPSVTQQPTQQDSNRQTSKIPPSATTENVICGKSYVADVVIIDGVNLVKKIIELKSITGKCELNIAGTSIGVSQKSDVTQKLVEVVLYDRNDQEQSADPFNQSVEIYQIDLNNNQVFFQNQLDGAFNNLGSWK